MGKFLYENLIPNTMLLEHNLLTRPAHHYRTTPSYTKLRSYRIRSSQGDVMEMWWRWWSFYFWTVSSPSKRQRYRLALCAPSISRQHVRHVKSIQKVSDQLLALWLIAFTLHHPRPSDQSHNSCKQRASGQLGNKMTFLAFNSAKRNGNR
jgi:hypothetical protein